MTGQWFFSPTHGQICQVIDSQSLWGEMTCRVWLPSLDAVAVVSLSDLQPIDQANTGTAEYIAYITSAARVADALTRGVLLAPIESSVIPLPHQIRALGQALANDSVRYLLADEVGLGKTIEAGLIMRELKLRGLVSRTLVIAPKGLVTQWVSEMRFHFGEHFQLVLPDDLKTLKRFASPIDYHNTASWRIRKDDKAGRPDTETVNIWKMFPQIVVPMDSVKPVEKRRGWTATQVAEYNRERFEDLVSAGWDLIIVDEAHRLGGSTDQVARYKLGQELSESAPYLLLLSATPHRGKTDAFQRLISLIDTSAFPDVESIVRERVQPYVIRTEKRHSIDSDGKPLFKPRRTELVSVSWEEHNRDQQHLYEAVTEYVRRGYNQARQEKRNYVGFLMLLMQRLVVSSTRAIRTTLERRLEILEDPEEQLVLFPLMSEDDWVELDGQEQLGAILQGRLKAIHNEREEVKLLLELARHGEHSGPDIKAEVLLDWIYRLQADEGDSDLKILIFTEFIPTQAMLSQFLLDRGFEVVCLNGSMEMEERKHVQEAFARRARILVSTDAGGEGLNLQFCHVVINYDIPWNPMRLEQRIGRVDRIGQNHEVRAINFIIQDSVEHRVREVLEEKLAIIYNDFGIDKTGDVLDSAQAAQIFDALYVEAILNPDDVESSVDQAVMQVQEQVQEIQRSISVLGAADDLNPEDAQKLMTHPLPHWIERMVTSYINACGGKAEQKDRTWELTWPGGETYTGVVFTGKEFSDMPTAHYLTLEDSRVRDLATKLPRFIHSQPVPVLSQSDFATPVSGFWSLWQLAIISKDRVRRRIYSLFMGDDGKYYGPTAKSIWDQLLNIDPRINHYLDPDNVRDILDQLFRGAEDQGRSAYDELLEEHHSFIRKEREKGEYSFAARRRIIERIGLPEVRGHRLYLLDQEEHTFRTQLEHMSSACPEMSPIMILRIEGDTD